jgi:serpin B
MSRSSFRLLLCLSVPVLASLACLPVRSGPPEEPPAGQGRVIARSGPAGPDSAAPAARATTTQVNALAAASNAFALDLYAHLRGGHSNLFFSPYSIATALAMTSAGARGQTLADISRVLHFPDQAELHPAASTLTDDLLRRAGRDVELATANALWMQKDRSVRDDFLVLTRTHYRAGFRQVDFIGNPESARRTINDWTQQQTRQRIRDLLQPGTVTKDTRLVLTNAVYFKARWDKAFDKARTRPDDFHLQDGRRVGKPMMHQTEDFGYAEQDDLQVLEMPYTGNDFSLVILLPSRGSSLAALEGRLGSKLGDWLAGLDRREVIVTIPQFEMTTALSLRDVLSRLGMTGAFSAAADFRGIDDGRDQLYLGDVIHKAFVEVNEQGTEAAAATAVTALPGAAAAPLFSPPRPPEFTADRPFVYLVRDNHTGVILFLGRYTGE